jgi:hypothetical protein
MKVVQTDARRYAWCRGHALWIMGMPARVFLEDLHGAQRAGQDELVRYCARAIGDACAVVLNLALFDRRPIPGPSVRSAWALEGLQGHELWEPCWRLIRGPDDEPTAAIVQRCDDLMDRVREIVGDIPDILSPDGYFPALALARDWLQLLATVGEPGFLPEDWTRRS